jgi:SAM-dependent methyltransferase
MRAVSETQGLFGERAVDYDTLRPQDGSWWRRFDALVREGDLRGRRVLDVGCGTGALAAALADRAHARVWGADPSAEMLDVARRRVPRSVGLKRSAAEALPFADEWFDRAVLSFVVHHLDRPVALREILRVLAPAGRIVIATFHERHFESYWAAPFFPSLAGIDRARFPTQAELAEQLEAAGFGAVRFVGLPDRELVDRDTALARLRGRHISTFDLIEQDEVDAGIARAELELPERVEVCFDQLLAIGERV